MRYKSCDFWDLFIVRLEEMSSICPMCLTETKKSVLVQIAGNGDILIVLKIKRERKLKMIFINFNFMKDSQSVSVYLGINSWWSETLISAKRNKSPPRGGIFGGPSLRS